MAEMLWNPGTFPVQGLVGCGHMDTNAALRRRASRLISLGVSQKVIAHNMGMTPSTFSKWLNEVEGINPPTVSALDGFNRYTQDLCKEAQSDPALTSAAEQERVNAETLVLETEHAQRRKRRAAMRSKSTKSAGKKIAGK